MSNTREHILKISLGLFLQKSFKEVTMKDIVENTGMSKGAFYHYFESKEQLFLEIINNEFSAVMENIYDRLNKKSLYDFYHDYINYFIGNSFMQNDEGDGITSLNYFSLIFDALKLFPSFHEKLHEHQQVEIDSWKEVVSEARKNGEINSKMNDEQIASMFIYSSDGIGIRKIFINGSSEDTKNRMLTLWDNFYEGLKK